MLYIEAGKIIEKAQNKEGSIKSLVFKSGSQDVKQLFALVCKTLKYASILEQVMAVAGLLQQEKWLKGPVAMSMTYDLLLGKGLRCRGKFKRAMKRNTPSLEAALADMKKQAKVASVDDLLPKQIRDKVAMPRYVRVNTLKTTAEEAEDTFKADGYECVLSRQEADELMQDSDPTINSTQGIHHIKSLQPKQFMADMDLSEVFVFAPGTDLHDHNLFKKKQVLLQDKASCIPAKVLSPAPGSHVIDGCAAPGNKTSHLAAIMQNTGKIFAFDSAKGRYHAMCKLVPAAGVTNTTFYNQDFLETNPDDDELSSVEYILVDPSCSGTGMVARQDYLTDSGEGPSRERLKLLSRVQLKILNHALSFPRVKRVVYSTCSIHAEENGQVVKQALDENPQFELKRVLPPWGQLSTVNRSGEEDPEMKKIKSLCLRSLPDEHRTNGFFVALFEKKDATFGGDDGDEQEVRGRKRNLEDDEEKIEDEEEEIQDAPSPKKKKSKKKKHKKLSLEVASDSSGKEGNDEIMVDPEDLVTSTHKKKKKVDLEVTPSEEDGSDHERTEVVSPSKHSKRKKKKNRQSLK
ncbi:28S rRNA (cytosine-C(5))-methyltransferase-like [Amphiura filiformis]|uniref:28S rRNA (cytosine-C(5))-methyltransferase-like n=1 Tax=Amphiura filiformis TaxID=82378 RepID=UPI003B2166AF